ncbi:tRNA N(3)-methylcytidine methyltransferase METTL2-like isoform X2 [Haliotis rufescens]|uniref:tRNA N(3)-methylcytidine methyltransferase METTL2-like isoform X2 n=1 Tax=Haliotis rufescens TaxID=6454 RepID=UPI00201F0D5F|nr:tRNA N(3)-methylcytidine methyltransferase METTL2-like isoform X2 [Haliotis rufescens]
MASNEDVLDDEKRPQFGNRYLTDPKNVFEHNAWDNVVWDSSQEEEARRKTQQQLAEALPQETTEMYEEKADHFWDEFYNIHTNRFFKDRHWLFVEFPELDSTNEKPESKTAGNMDARDYGKTDCSDVAQGVENISLTPTEHQADTDKEEVYPGENADFRIFEVGCGVGNTVFPVLQTNNDPKLMVYCCDFSSTAIQIVKEHTDCDPRRCTAFVCDISDTSAVLPMPDNSLDLIIMIFVLSAINPQKMQFVIDRLSRLLKPGGQILFRDYGRYDMAQLRFKKGRCLSENFYVRGDGTRVYFFTQEELRDMFSKCGLVEKQNLIDRRLQVNRGKQLKMYRVWIQCKYQKPAPAACTTQESTEEVGDESHHDRAQCPVDNESGTSS